MTIRVFLFGFVILAFSLVAGNVNATTTRHVLSPVDYDIIIQSDTPEVPGRYDLSMQLK
jgi:hypothetical protein